MSKCNSLYQEKQEAILRQKYQEYCAELDEGEIPMTLDEFADDLAYQADYERMTREP